MSNNTPIDITIESMQCLSKIEPDLVINNLGLLGQLLNNRSQKIDMIASEIEEARINSE